MAKIKSVEKQQRIKEQQEQKCKPQHHEARAATAVYN